MTSRFTKRNRSSSKLDGYSNGDQATLKRIKDLEKALEERDKKVAELQDKIQELTGELDRRKRLVEVLTSDRNDLRQKNASLVNKLAELSRKQSVSSFTTLPSPPRLPRRGTELPPTPSTPDTPFESPGAGSPSTSKFNFSTPDSSLKQNGVRHFTRNTIHLPAPSKIQEESDTDYSDMEESETTSTAVATAAVKLNVDDDKSEFVNSGMVRESEIDSVLAAVQQTTINMQCTHANSNSNSYKGQSSPKVAPEKSSGVESVKSESVVEKNPLFEDLDDQRPHRESVGALAAKFERVASAGKMAMSSPPTKHRAGAANYQGSPHSPSAISDTTSSDSSPPEPTVKRSSSLRDENGETSAGKHNRTPSTRSAGHASTSDSKRVSTGSASIASKISSLIADRRSPKVKTSPLIERRDTSTTNDTSTSEHNAIAQTEPEASTTTTTAATTTSASKMAADFKDVRTGTAPSPMMKSKQDSIVSNIGSEIMSSGDYSTTDIDSSIDFTSPLTSPASSLGASSIHEARRAAVKKVRDNMGKKSARFTDEIEEEDGLGELMDSIQIMRSRTKTLSLTSGVATRTTVELGRINERTRRAMKEKQFAHHKRHHSLTDLRLIRGEFTKELELISPDFESKIKEKIQHGVGKKYGGLEKANQAAIKIQQCWRQYKLKSRFQKIKQQNKSQLQLQMRKRAQSMRDPRRRPSIMRKRYNREKSVQQISSKHQMADLSPRQERRAMGLAQVRTAPSATIGEKLEEGDEEEMGVVQERAEISCTMDGNTYSEPPAPLGTPTTPVCFKLNDLSVVTEPPMEPEPPTTPKNTPDGLTSSSSYTGEFLTASRPLSVFSTGSSVSSSGSYQNDLHAVGRGGRTMPRLRGGMVRRELEARDRSYSVASGLSRKKSIGINHFNRKPTKGIQYLVESQVLDDDPNSVANFLTDSTKNKLSKQKIGEFVGEINSDFNMAVLGCLLEQMEMSGKPIDIALRELQQLFRMPGEAQKIDKIMEIFALEYFKNNKEEGAIKSEDSAYILSFAIMMLHTALHNPSVKHKTTKREWVSMNRGCNDGENFPENFLLEIYERIHATEFICGRDHTQEVAEIEKQIIIGATDLPKLTTPQRHLVLRIAVTEVVELSSRPNFRQRHRRTLFVFNDMLIVCKQRRHEQYQCRNFFPLLHVLPVKFETEYHRNGLQLLSAIERKPLLQCTCDNLGERTNLLEKLEEAIRDLEEMENERIEELGTSLSAKPGQDTHLGGSVRHNSTKSLRPSNSLASSSLTDLRNQSPMEEDEIGVNELGEEDGQLRPLSSVSSRNNRSSGDSGFDSSQQDTPTSTPTPSPTEQNHIEATDSATPSPSPSPSPSLIPPSSPHSLVPDTTIRHSKSHDGLRTLTVYPATPDRSPSAELVRNSRSVTASPTHKKAGKKEKTPKEPKEKKKSHYVNIFSLGRSKGKDSKSNSGGSPGGSPLHSRKRRASDSPQVLHNVRSTSPSGVNLSQSLHTSSGGWYGTSSSDHEDQS